MQEPLRALLEYDGSTALTDWELRRTRVALGARADSCWDRLDDVVSELVALHEAPPDDVLRRVRRMIQVELADRR